MVQRFERSTGEGLRSLRDVGAEREAVEICRKPRQVSGTASTKIEVSESAPMSCDGWCSWDRYEFGATDLLPITLAKASILWFSSDSRVPEGAEHTGDAGGLVAPRLWPRGATI